VSEHRVFRVGGISTSAFPAPDPQASADFYEAVFGWKIRRDRDDPAFEDGSGHLIGHFRAQTMRWPATAACGPYVFVENVDETLQKRRRRRPGWSRSRTPEGDLWVGALLRPGRERGRRVAARPARLG